MYSMFHQFGHAKFSYGDLILSFEPTALAALKNKAHFKSGQNSMFFPLLEISLRTPIVLLVQVLQVFKNVL